MSARRTLVALALVAACGQGVRHSPDARYLGLILNARDLGAEELKRLASDDPTLAAYVARMGTPDFLIEPSADDVELVYYRRSVLAHFHRDAEGRTTVSEVAPLPGSLIALLPRDIRAGTTLPTGGTGCWSTTDPRRQLPDLLRDRARVRHQLREVRAAVSRHLSFIGLYVYVRNSSA